MLLNDVYKSRARNQHGTRKPNCEKKMTCISREHLFKEKDEYEQIQTHLFLGVWIDRQHRPIHGPIPPEQTQQVSHPFKHNKLWLRRRDVWTTSRWISKAVQQVFQTEVWHGIRKDNNNVIFLNVTERTTAWWKQPKRLETCISQQICGNQRSKTRNNQQHTVSLASSTTRTTPTLFEIQTIPSIRMIFFLLINGKTSTNVSIYSTIILQLIVIEIE